MTKDTVKNLVIDAQNLYKCYPGFPPVLRGVNIELVPGEMVAIMGPSGCGKSTMLHVLGMLHAPDSGSLQVLGTDVLTLSREQTAAFRRGNMGFVMQSSNLFEHSTVFENVEFPLIYENVPPEERWERAIRALELVRLSHRVSYRSNRLSGGEQQRVAIARAMVNNPRILLADEPTGALDAKTSKVVMNNFCSLAHEGGIAMIIVTHDPGVAEYCDTVYTLEEGVLVCHRKTPVPAVSGGGVLLQAKERLCHGVCVVDAFPTVYDTGGLQHVLSMHEARVLTRVYSLRAAPLSSIVSGEYALPVLMKRQSALQTCLSLFSLLRTKKNNPGVLWRYWKSLPVGSRLNVFRAARHVWHFAKGARMVPWCLADLELGSEHGKKAHIHALGAGKTATAAWVAAGILNIPFSFSVRAHELKQLSLVRSKAQYASFVSCDSETTQKALQAACQAAYPDYDVSRIRCVYEPSSLLPHADDMADGVLPQGAAPGTPQGAPLQGVVHVLMACHRTQSRHVSHVLRACRLLRKRGVPVELTLVGSGHRYLRWRCALSSLRKFVHFKGVIPHEHMTELYRRAHIFVDASGDDTGVGGVGTSLMEAMLFGVPIVTRGTAWHAEVLTHEKSALFYEGRGRSESAQCLSEALERLSRFPDFGQELGRAAQEFALTHFTPQTQSELLGRFICESAVCAPRA